MTSYQVYREGRPFHVFETFNEAKAVATPMAVKGAEVTIELPQAPAQTIVWRYSTEIEDWVEGR